MPNLDITSLIRWAGRYENPLDLESPVSIIAMQFPEDAQEFHTGTGANQGNVLWSDQRTLVATSETLDFRSLVGLVDAFGTLVNLTAMRQIVIENLSTNPTDVLILTGNLLSHIGSITNISLGPGGVFLISDPIDGWAMATGDLLAVDSQTVTISYRIGIVGNL